MLRSAPFVLLFASVASLAQSSAQPPARAPEPSAPSAAATFEPISAEIADAEAAIVKSDWKSAETKLDLWLGSHPADARALFDAGYVADSQNRLDDAAALYRRSVDANPQSFEAHLSLGLLLARRNRYADARPELAAATHLDPGEAGPVATARAWRALARLNSTTDPTEASSDLLEALKLTPETPADTFLAATIADQAGQYDAAEAAYRRLLAANPAFAPANAGLAHLLIARKKFPEAETLLRTALEKTPDDPALNAQLATVYVAQDKAEALPLVQKLHEAHPADAAITRILAQVLADAGDFPASDHLYTALLKDTPNDPVLLICHGQNLIRQAQFAEAFTAFNKATELDPANPDGWSGLAFAASRTNQPSITLHALTMRSKYLAEMPSTYFLWATAYDSLHQKVQAAAYYHHFLDAAAGKFPDQEWQAQQRIKLLEKKP